MSKTFILTDERVFTSHGFYLDNAGARLERFKENPVMLYNHNSDEVIGRWTEIRFEDGRLLAVPEFDPDDEMATKVAGKVEKGFIRGASLGIHIHKAENRLEKTGKLALHVTDWEVFEASVVPIPSNSAALTLRVLTAEGSELSGEMLSRHISHLAALYKPENQNKKMNEIALTAPALTALGLDKAPQDYVSLSAAIVALAARAAQAERKAAELKDADQVRLAAQATNLVEAAIKDGRITAECKTQWLSMLKTDFAAAADALAALPARSSITQRLKAGGSAAQRDRDDWNYMDWLKKDPKGLATLKATDPQAWEELHDGYIHA